MRILHLNLVKLINLFFIISAFRNRKEMSQPSLVKKKPRAKDLSCILADLVSKYSGLELKSCETKASQV